MQQWEYLVADAGVSGLFTKVRLKERNEKEMPRWKDTSLWGGLNALGSEGWELAAIQTFEGESQYIFKRSKV